MTSKMYYNGNGDGAYMFECCGEIRVSVDGERRDYAFDTEFQADKWLRGNGYAPEDGSEPETMTLAKLRELFPRAEFTMYDARGNEVRHTPHLYARVEDFEHHVTCHVEDGDSWTTERLSIELAA